MLPNPEFFGITTNWFTFFNSLALVASFLFACWYYFRKSSIQVSWLQFFGMICLLYFTMMAGGRLIGFLEFYFQNGTFPQFSFFFKEPEAGGFRWGGSLLFALLIFPFLAQHMLKLKSFPALFDMLALCFCLFTVFIKQGCQFAGDGCYGIATTLPWGMHYPYGLAPNILPVHPTPVYDSLFHLLLFVGLLFWDAKKKKQPGQTAKWYFILVAAFYILLDFIKVNTEVIWGVSLNQIVYALILLLCISAFKTLTEKHNLFKKRAPQMELSHW